MTHVDVNTRDQTPRCMLTQRCVPAAAAVQETVLRLRFVGPPRFTLSGTTLETGVDVESFEAAACAIFYGEVTAQPELQLFNRAVPRVVAPKVVVHEEPSLMEM